jgi:hypothetical protein
LPVPLADISKLALEALVDMVLSVMVTPSNAAVPVNVRVEPSKVRLASPSNSVVVEPMVVILFSA